MTKLLSTWGVTTIFALAFLYGFNSSLSKSTQNDCQYFGIAKACEEVNK